MEKQESKIANMEESILQALQCAFCFEPSVPLYMCVKGHNVCADCNQDLYLCPECRTPGRPAFQNIALNELGANVLPYHCKNNASGCIAKRITEASIMFHYNACVYEYNYLCKCNVIGVRSDYLRHMMVEHPEWCVAPRLKYCQTFNDDTQSHSVCLILEDNQNDFFIVTSGYDQEKEMYYFYSRYFGPCDDMSIIFKMKFTLETTGYDSTVIAWKEPFNTFEDFRSHENTIVIGKRFFPKSPLGHTVIFITLELKIM